MLLYSIRGNSSLNKELPLSILIRNNIFNSLNLTFFYLKLYSRFLKTLSNKLLGWILSNRNLSQTTEQPNH
jgi:hypothetical protein